MDRIVDSNTPPTDNMESWERSLSPWHRDAFPDELKSAAPEQGDRKEGWIQLDAWGNSIGWVPDGTIIKEVKP